MNSLRLSHRTGRTLDALWLLMLAAYVLSGMMLASFHGDESMLLYMSHDYATAFLDKAPQRLITVPPYEIDQDGWLRILNGSVPPYSIGLSWHIAGFSVHDLPPRPGWDWGLDYDTNVATGHRPSDGLLAAGRFASTFFLTLSIPVLFALAWQFGGRPLAYFASGLYALHPVILLNGRRSMMEGSPLFFGLLVVLIASIVIRKQEQGERVAWPWWAALTLSGALALSSKHSGIVYVAGAFGGIFVIPLLHRRWRETLLTTGKMAVSGIALLTLFIALSPALWNDPIARLSDLLAVRQGLLSIQVAIDPYAPMDFTQRLAQLVIQPFIAPLVHFEMESWAGFDRVTAEVARYMASPLSGLQFGIALGVPLTLLAGFGIVVALWSRLRPGTPNGRYVLLLAWLFTTCASLLVNPLPWQRYYLPLIPIVILLAGIGLQALLQQVTQTRSRASQFASA